MFTITNEDLMFLISVNNNSKNKEVTHLITKMAVLNATIECDLWKVSQLAKTMNIDEFNIFYIYTDDEYKSEIYNIDDNIKFIEIGIVSFMETLATMNSKFWNYNKNSIFILKKGNYSDIKFIFSSIENKEVKVVRGSSQKSHMVSPIDFRLSTYLMIFFDMDYKKFNQTNSFHYIEKDKYLPSSTK